MNNRSKTGLQILQIAIGLGILGDILLRHMPWGLNVLLFNLAFGAAMVTLLWHRKREYLTPQTWALIGAQVFFAAMFVLRDSAELRLADSVAIVAILSVLFVPKLKVSARIAGVFHYIVGFLWSALNAAFAACGLLAVDIEWKGENRSVWAKNAVAVVRGLLLVTPLILIFGGLFMAADAAYEGLVQRVFNVNLNVVFSHFLIFAFFSWFSAGYLRGIMLGGEPKFAVDPAVVQNQPDENKNDDNTGASKVEDLKNDNAENPTTLPNNVSILEHINKSDPPDTSGETKKESIPDPKTEPKKTWQWANVDNTLLPSAFTLGTVEVGVVLGLINLLFLSFVIVQLPYLFGGMDLVQNTPDFKLAEYARRGFGELVAVSALVLPVLLIGHWLIRKDNPFTEKLFRGLASIQIVLLFIIMASAVQRLVLLTGNLGYGMTTVRLYPMIFMIWLGVVFVWFALTVLRGYRRYFAWGALWSAIFVLAATHFLNPDEFIVRTNIQLMRQGRQFDAGYNSSLSADAIPALLDGLQSINFEDQCQLKLTLHNKYRGLGESDDIRSFNWSRKRGWHLLHQNDSLLHDVEGCPS
jgi:hypothetical protein